MPHLPFLSTLSLRRATTCGGGRIEQSHYFYPRSPCGERPVVPAELTTLVNISIHALLAESDSITFNPPIESINFYPRSPCGERQHAYQLVLWVLRISIHALLAESDLATWQSDYVRGDFYPRSPCGERLPHARRPCPVVHISIHALLAESDPEGRAVLFNFLAFLSTLSLRRATPGRRGRAPGW